MTRQNYDVTLTISFHCYDLFLLFSLEFSKLTPEQNVTLWEYLSVSWIGGPAKSGSNDLCTFSDICLSLIPFLASRQEQLRQMAGLSLWSGHTL